jgi:hypothetical protein
MTNADGDSAMQRALLIVFAIATLAWSTAASGETNPVPEAGPLRALESSEPSAEQLIDRFLGALVHKDPDALRRLRVTETEYREILMPTSVPEGQPLRRPSKAFADLAWGLIDEKSRYYEQSLLTQYGGLQLRLKDVSYDKGEQRFAGYTARRQLRLRLTDDSTGAEFELATGSIVEVAGTYKFVSYIRD